jgi:hypothetical protein
MQDTQYVYCSPLSVAEPRNLFLILMKERTTLESYMRAAHALAVSP